MTKESRYEAELMSCILHSYALEDQVVDDWIKLPRDSFGSRYMFFSMPTTEVYVVRRQPFQSG